MIGTIRKHSKWMWFVIIAATIVSFLFWGGMISRQNGGGGQQSNNLGSIDGKPITPDAYLRAQNGVDLYYLFNTGQWPTQNPKITQDDLQREIYIRLFMLQKAANLGIYVDSQDVAQKAAGYLNSLGRNNQTVTLNEFVRQVLQPENLTAEDFENFVHDDLVMQQLAQIMSLAGSFITPQEAAEDYRRENQELSAQIVYFSATNYLSQVTVTPQAVKQFYTNYLAEYRLPDRVQVSYVAFELSNYLAQAQAQLEKTNLSEMVESYFRQLGTNYFTDAKTPDEAKAKIRKELINRQAGADAVKDANDFAGVVFNESPVKSENLATVAKEKGLTVHTTEPFSSELGPEAIGPLEDFTKAAFNLTPDDPFAGPIEGPDAIYVIALDKNLPSEIPPFDQIHERVTADYRFHEATALAREAGTNFMLALTIQMATGRSFSSACAARGLRAENLPPFSLDTQQLPEFESRGDLSQLKQAAFSTAPGKTSGFNQTDDGGFIVYVKSRLPIDKATMDADLPKFTDSLRLDRQREVFNNWLQREGSQALRDTPWFQKQASAGNAGK